MKKYKVVIILINLVLILFLFNKSVFEKEKLLKNGNLIFLKLAPVDPRSLMQGDYMDLNYEISRISFYDSIPKRGYCIVRLDSNGIAQRIRMQPDPEPLKQGEFPIVYTSGRWNINIGAESYFFEEGEAYKYDSAKYGGLIIDSLGNSLLVGLYDKNLKMLE